MFINLIIEPFPFAQKEFHSYSILKMTDDYAAQNEVIFYFGRSYDIISKCFIFYVFISESISSTCFVVYFYNIFRKSDKIQ